MPALFESLVSRLGIIIVVAYLLSRFAPFKRLIIKKHIGLKEKLTLAGVFGLIGILGTYFGIPVRGAIANSRVVGVLIGGLLGGPVVGMGSGFIAGFHRWAIDINGFTALACALSTFVEGTMGGVLHRYIIKKKNKWLPAFFICAGAELIQMLIILAVAKPFSDALALVRIIWLPMVLVNSLGTAAMMGIIQNIFLEKARIGAHQAQLALTIADQTLSILRQGLNEKTAAETAKIIYKYINAAAVAITDRNKILAHVGVGEDHHRPGLSYLTGGTSKVMATGKYYVAQNRKAINCSNPTCQLASAVVVPLKEKDKVIGTLKIYQTSENAITSVEIELALGLAQMFSTQLELAKAEHQAKLLNKAELRALQAQVNPHFLFNALNTIRSLVRTDPEKARDLLAHLADYFRTNLQHKADLVDLHEEIQHVKSYLAIEEARFGDRLKVHWDIDEYTEVKLPPFILQPIVENAIKHGLYPKAGLGNIYIRLKETRDKIILIVEDNGVGMRREDIKKYLEGPETAKHIGISNVNNRIKSRYGKEYGLDISSKPNCGTKVRIMLPKEVTD
ncbi:MAG: sensor histidine kinase [Thermoanaerobacteraceae bacterium]|nr:sensor histidine kinase [Thermoanaerobacteraceae bacterium]